MRKFMLRVQWLSLIAILATFLSHSVSAAEFTELPKPQWTVRLPENTTTDYFDKHYYTLGRKYLPILSKNNGSTTAFTLLYQNLGGKTKPSYKVMALDDAMGNPKWIRSLPYSYNAFDMDLNGNLYYIE